MDISWDLYCFKLILFSNVTYKILKKFFEYNNSFQVKNSSKQQLIDNYRTIKCYEFWLDIQLIWWQYQFYFLSRNLVEPIFFVDCLKVLRYKLQRTCYSVLNERIVSYHIKLNYNLTFHSNGTNKSRTFNVLQLNIP